MEHQLIQKNNRQVAIWLFIGVAMIMVQVLLGGITRLTESGLSITEWKPITGALPPLNEQAWQGAFDKYKLTDQFKYVHAGFSLHDFKFIFFWEWFHRLWARWMGMVFLIGFVYFLFQKKFNQPMIRPMMVLFVLGALQGAIGWIMVQSGLVPEKYFVGHVELATHFIAAMGLLAYTYWFALKLLIPSSAPIFHRPLHRLLMQLLLLLILQLSYGAFMAGLKAGQSAPTWPSINGYLIPPSISELTPFYKNLLNNNITIQFIHRGLAYLILIVTVIWWIKAADIKNNKLFSAFKNAYLIIIVLQVVLGIITVLNAAKPTALVWLGTLHQFTGMLTLVALVSLLYLIRRRPIAA